MDARVRSDVQLDKDVGVPCSVMGCGAGSAPITAALPSTAVHVSAIAQVAFRDRIDEIGKNESDVSNGRRHRRFQTPPQMVSADRVPADGRGGRKKLCEIGTSSVGDCRLIRGAVAASDASEPALEPSSRCQGRAIARQLSTAARASSGRSVTTASRPA
jgi:hypothetical protein